ncbi:MAG: hypothetical protein HWN67_16755 [Candidatus Helarchaeota archaeon]|nr:hypothetical protein [Candidatus Helarchaeota archaeon]
MSQKCKNLESQAKTLLKEDPLKAKDTYINAAECYNKNFKKKDYKKVMIKAIKILQDYCKPLDPFKGREYIEEAAKYYEKLELKEESNSIMISLADKFADYAKKIEKSNLNLVNAIKYFLSAEELYLEYGIEQKYQDCTISAYNICALLGITLERIFQYFQKKAE